MNEDNSEQDNNKYAHETRDDLGVFSGAALVGGTKLFYQVGKDVVSWFKTEKKLFIQVLNSRYVDGQHSIVARFAGAHIHSIYIESVCIKGGQPADIQTFKFIPDDVGFGPAKRKDHSERRTIYYPYLLPPGEAVDMQISVTKQTDESVCKKKGIELICEFSLLDKLGDIESVSKPIRLRWP